MYSLGPVNREFIEIVNEAAKKDSDDDSFSDLDGAEVVELEVLQNLIITNMSR